MFSTNKQAQKSRAIVLTTIAIVIWLLIIGTSIAEKLSQYNVFRLSPEMSEYFVFKTPEEFCEKKGEGGIWENNYSFAFVDKKGNLVLILTDEEVQTYKNNSHYLQVLQAVLGDTRDIGVEINYEYDPLYFIEFAPTCGIEVSEDFRTITKGPGGNRFHVSVVAAACMEIQILNGVPSDEITVDYYLYDENGNVKQHISFPEAIDTEYVLE